MVRADKNWPDVYFGRPGAFVKMPYPRDEVDRPYERVQASFGTAAGQYIISSMAGGSRPFVLNWRALHMDTYDLLAQYWTGMMGQGPWCYVDPSMPNMLLPNQASATNLYSDTRHFAVTSGALSSNITTAHIHRVGATRSLRWLWVSAPGATTPTLSLSYPYRSWFGYPVVPGLSYAFSSWLKPDGTVDTSITAGMRLEWVTATNGALSTTSSSNVATTTWTRHSVVGVAPAGAAFVKPAWIVDGSTVAAGGSLYVDEPLLEQDTVVNDWGSGTGLRPVEITGLNDNGTFNARFRRAPSMTLREVTP